MSRLVSFLAPEPCFAEMREAVIKRARGKVYAEERYFNPSSPYYVLNERRAEQIEELEESDEALRQAFVRGLLPEQHFTFWDEKSLGEKEYWLERWEALNGRH